MSADTRSVGIVILLGSLLGAHISEAAIYYVAKSGSDSNTCAQAQSVSTSKLTIAGGLSCMKSGGDTLIVKAGTYSEYITHNQIHSGTSNTSRTTIRAATEESVIIQPLTGTPNRGTGHAIWVFGKNYVTLDGLIVDGVNVSGSAIFINNKSSFIRIENMEVKNAPGNCIAAQVGFNVEILNSKIHDCGVDNLQHGIYLRGNNHLVEGNEIYNITGHGIHQWNKHDRENNNNIIRQNYIHDNGSRGILIGSGSNNVAYKNTLRNNGRHSGEGGISVGFKSPDNNQVYDNIIHSSSGSCIVISRGSTNSKVNNNVCWQNGSDSVKDGGSESIITNTRVIKPFD